MEITRDEFLKKVSGNLETIKNEMQKEFAIIFDSQINNLSEEISKIFNSNLSNITRGVDFSNSITNNLEKSGLTQQFKMSAIQCCRNVSAKLDENYEVLVVNTKLENMDISMLLDNYKVACKMINNFGLDDMAKDMERNLNLFVERICEVYKSRVLSGIQNEFIHQDYENALNVAIKSIQNSTSDLFRGNEIQIERRMEDIWNGLKSSIGSVDLDMLKTQNQQQDTQTNSPQDLQSFIDNIFGDEPIVTNIKEEPEQKEQDSMVMDPKLQSIIQGELDKKFDYLTKEEYEQTVKEYDELSQQQKQILEEMNKQQNEELSGGLGTPLL